MALGQTLRQAREKRGLTTKQVAESTRMLVQVVEALEQEDFRRIAAPLYGRGFIKLYAECVGVDHEPLVAEFMDIFTGNRPPQIARRAAPAAAEPALERPAAADSQQPQPRESAAARQADRAPRPEPPAPAAPAASAAPKRELPEIMPLDAPAGDSEPDLFTRARPASPPVARPVPRRSVTTPSGMVKPAAARPFSGRDEASPPAADAAGSSPVAGAPQQAQPRPAKPRIRVTPVLERSRAVGRELARIWNALPVYTDKRVKARAMLAAAIIAAAAILILAGRAVRNRIDRQASGAETLHGLRVLPPPLPYAQ